MLLGDDEWMDRMPWVPAMPGNKTYVLQEAQKEIERLRQEIKRLRVKNQELLAGTAATKGLPVSEYQEEPSERPREREMAHPGNGDYLYITGVVKILGRA